MEQLRQVITVAFETLKNIIFENFRRNLLQRAQLRMQRNREHFEQFLSCCVSTVRTLRRRYFCISWKQCPTGIYLFVATLRANVRGGTALHDPAALRDRLGARHAGIGVLELGRDARANYTKTFLPVTHLVFI